MLIAYCIVLYCIVCRDNSQYYSPVLNNPATSQVFINNILGIIDKYNLDGVDLDWEVNTNKENLLVDRYFDLNCHLIKYPVKGGAQQGIPVKNFLFL